MSAVDRTAVRGVQDPARVRTLDDLVHALRRLRAGADDPSYSEIVRRIAEMRARRGIPASECTPGRITVYDCFRTGRRRLDAELLADVVQALGADPAPWRLALRRTLAGPALSATAGPRTAAPCTAADGWPAECPGRERELAWLAGASYGVAVVTGMPGVGKTRLALCAAQRMAGSGVRLRAALHGHGPAGQPAEPHAVLGVLLRGLGMPEESVRRLGRAERGAAYRRLTAQSAAVVVLDDAAGAAQVRELLPGGDALAVVTSRRELPGLDAPQLALAPLAPRDSLALLAGAANGERLRAEPESALRMAALCGHLPLELTAAAERIAVRPGWSLADHVHLLEQCPGSPALNCALDASYRRLDPTARAMFRLLGLHPGGVITSRSAAALAACPEAPAAGALDRLRADHLTEALRRGPAGDRPEYVLHDLVSRYAKRLAAAHIPYSAQRRALARLAESEHRPAGARAAEAVR